MFNLPMNFRNFTPIFIVFSLLFSIIIGLVSLWPKFQEIKEIKKNIEEKETEIKMAQDYLSELQKIKTDLEKYEIELSKIDSALPDNPSVAAFFNFVQKVSSQSGLTLERLGSFTTAPSTNLPGLKETVLGFNVIGSYASFRNFLSTLEKSARLIELENLSFSSKGETETKEKNIFAFSLRVKLYSY